MHKLRPGAIISARELMTFRSKRIQLPDPAGVVHLQFRRYAGCPFCDLHLRSIVQRHQELVAAGIREVVVFQSSSAELLAQQGDVPFAVVADPTRRLYAEFGVGSSLRAGLDPGAGIVKLSCQWRTSEANASGFGCWPWPGPSGKQRRPRARFSFSSVNLTMPRG